MKMAEGKQLTKKFGEINALDRLIFTPAEDDGFGAGLRYTC
jgi:hypothetical protein